MKSSLVIRLQVDGDLWQDFTLKFHLIPKLGGLTPEKQQNSKEQEVEKHFAYWKPPALLQNSCQISPDTLLSGGVPT